MKGFIELTYQSYQVEAKYTFNVSQIVWFSSTSDGKRTCLILGNGINEARFTVSESYEEVKRLIAEAVGNE